MITDVVTRVRSSIESGHLQELIGLEEGLTVEAKGAIPYDLDDPAGRYELAKDVSSLANSAGGLLLVGLKTRASEAEPTDVVIELELLPEVDFPASKIKGIIGEYVAPSIAGLRVVWLPSVPEDGMGIGVIEVPTQSEDAKPFIICKVIDGDSRLKQVVFGYCRRIGSDSVPHDAGTILRALRQGMNPLSQRLTGIEQKLGLVLEGLAESHQATAAGQPSLGAASELLAERVNRILGE